MVKKLYFSIHVFSPRIFSFQIIGDNINPSCNINPIIDEKSLYLVDTILKIIAKLKVIRKNIIIDKPKYKRLMLISKTIINIIKNKILTKKTIVFLKNI